MTWKRNLVVLGVVIFAAFGLLGLLAPAKLLELIGAGPGGTDAHNDIRAMYGGAELAIACLLLASLRKPGWLDAGLLLQTTIFAGMAASRAFSVALDGTPGAALLLAGAAEAAGAAAGMIALRSRQ